MVFNVLVAVALLSCQSGEQERIQTLDGARISDLVRNQGDNELSADAMPKLTFEHSTHHFDSIPAGSIVDHTFSFVNSGKGPLLITSVKSSCGCTVPTWPRGVIQAGDGGDIAVSFDSKNRSGFVSKDIRILANTNPAETMLTIKAYVTN